MRKALVPGCLLVVAVVAAAVATGKDAQPELVLTSESSGQLDCSEAVVVACSENVVNSTPPGSDGVGNVGRYGCNDLTYFNAHEFVYEICLGGEGGDLVVVMHYDHHATRNDLDLFLLDDCDPERCLGASVDAGGTEAIRIDDLPPGTYYAVVDGFRGRQDGSPHEFAAFCMSPCVDAVTPVTWGKVKTHHTR